MHICEMYKTLQMCIRSQCLRNKIWQKKIHLCPYLQTYCNLQKGRQICKCVHNSQKAFSSKTWKYTQVIGSGSLAVFWCVACATFVLWQICKCSVWWFLCVLCLLSKKVFNEGETPSLDIPLFLTLWHDVRGDHKEKSFKVLSSKFIMNSVNPH